MTEEKTLTMKDLAFKEVFLRPTGNNRRSRNPKEIIDDLLFVESTARKIANTFLYAQHYEKLDRETITKVANLLGIQIGD